VPHSPSRKRRFCLEHLVSCLLGYGVLFCAAAPVVFYNSYKKSPEKLDANSKRMLTQTHKTVI
ncbi:hypothetical protein ACW73S_10645, partial [Faecalibacterium duncaniae]|jgi:hypothetical protein